MQVSSSCAPSRPHRTELHTTADAGISLRAARLRGRLPLSGSQSIPGLGGAFTPPEGDFSLHFTEDTIHCDILCKFVQMKSHLLQMGLYAGYLVTGCVLAQALDRQLHPQHLDFLAQPVVPPQRHPLVLIDSCGPAWRDAY